MRTHICLTGYYFKARCLIENYAMPLVEKDGFDADGSRDSGQDHMGMDGCIDELVAVAYQPVIGREFSRARAPSHPAMDTFLQVVPKAQLRWWLMPHRIDIYIYIVRTSCLQLQL